MSGNTSTTPLWRISNRFRGWLPAILLSVGVILLWQLLVVIYEIPVYILPEPLEIARELGSRTGSLFVHLGWTMREAVGGFIIGCSLAFLTAVVFVQSRLLERSFYPWTVVLQTVPIVAIAPLLTIWLGFGVLPKMVISAIICFFPMLVNSLRGLRSISPQALELMQILSASQRQVMVRLRIPSSMPYLFTGLKLAATLSVVGAIVGEFTGADYGIGKVILVASYQQDTKLLFAGLVYSSAAALLFFLVVILVERLVLHWQEER